MNQMAIGNLYNMPQKKYYRNLITIDRFEAETLWFLENGLLILADEDDHAFFPADVYLKHFYQVEAPELV